jgi:protein SCO1/2
MRNGISIIAALVFCWAAAPIAVAEEDLLSGVSPAFELLSADGSEVTLADFRGKYVLVAFGFTHCLHICPMIAANMARALGSSDTEAVGVFVSVDTERDTPAITHAYAGRFGESMIGLGGSHAQVSSAAKSFNVTFVVTKSQDSYTVQHTPSIFLVSPSGELIDSFAMNTPTDTIVAAMR